MAIVSGTGLDLGGLFDRQVGEIPFNAAPELARFVGTPAVPGHRRRYLFGTCRDVEVVLQEGRYHAYEGFDIDALAAPFGVLRRLGVQEVLLASAAGGLAPELTPGQLVGIDCISAFPPRIHARGGTDPEDPARLESPPECGYTGRYMWVPGPNYETRAEIAALRRLDGSVVGMSLLPEVLGARQYGLKPFAVSCVTNKCCGGRPVSHDVVVAAASKASSALVALIRAWVSCVGQAGPHPCSNSS